MADGNAPQRTAVLVSSARSSAGVEEMRRRAADGSWPRKDWLEVARRLDAEVLDAHFMQTRAGRTARLVAAVAGLPAGQVCEAFLRRRQYQRIVAWADRLGLPLALLFKLTRSHPTLVLRSVDLAYWKKSFFVRHLHVHTALQAIVTPSTKQLEIAAERLGVPRPKLHFHPHGVDPEFWRAQEISSARVICSVGWEARDYATLARAVADLPVEVHVASGTVMFPEPNSQARADPLSRRTRGHAFHEQWREELGGALPSTVRWHEQLDRRALRNLYARSLFVVVPLFDVEFDAGATAILEAMAMGKAIVLTRTSGQIDLVADGENGLYVAPRDPAALRAAIEYLLDHPEEAERMGRAGRGRVEGFAIDAYAESFARLVSTA